MADNFRTDRLSWDDVRVFLALGRWGGLSAAARALGVTHATVSRRVSDLEQTLGTALVERRQSGYDLTPAGQKVLEIASRMETDSEELRRLDAASGLQGVVRVTSVLSLSQAYLVRRLAALQIQHPGLEIELSPSTRSFSLVRRETDIALRLNVPSDGTVKARRLCEVGYGLYASADVFAELHDGKPPRFITFDEVNNSVPEAVWVMKAFPGARVSFRVSDLVSQGVGAAEGCGVALLPHFVAATVPGLVRWMPPETPPTRVLWMITRPDAESGPHINAVALAVAEMVRADAGYFNPDGMALEAGALLS